MITERTTMRLSLTALFAIFLAPLSSCFDAPKPECAFACGAQNSCPTDYRCAGDGWCKRSDIAENFVCGPVSLIDGSTPDAPAVDGGPDAAEADAALFDAAVPDAALPDAARPDAALPDAGAPDAEIPDAAPV